MLLGYGFDVQKEVHYPMYVKTLKALYLCLLGTEESEAKNYLLLAKKEAKKLYEYSGVETDKTLLDEILKY